MQALTQLNSKKSQIITQFPPLYLPGLNNEDVNNCPSVNIVIKISLIRRTHLYRQVIRRVYRFFVTIREEVVICT